METHKIADIFPGVRARLGAWGAKGRSRESFARAPARLPPAQSRRLRAAISYTIYMPRSIFRPKRPARPFAGPRNEP